MKEKKKHIFVLHNDLDGTGCKFLAEYAFGKHASTSPVSNSQVDNVIKKVLAKEKNKDAVLWITDITPSSKVIEEQLEEEYLKGRNIILIDHHETAMHFNQYQWADVKVVENGKTTSATSLLYTYLKEKGYIEGNTFLDDFVELVRLYDTWEWEITHNEKAKALNNLLYLVGMTTFVQTLLEKTKQNPNKEFYFNDIERTILDIEQKKISSYIKNKSQKIVQIMLDDKAIGIVYAENYISEVGNDLGKLFPHLDVIAIVNMNTKRISLRTVHDHVSVSDIARKFGGGGHAKSSGISITEEVYEIFIQGAFFEDTLKFDIENKFNVKNVHEKTYYENADKKNFIIKTIEHGYIIQSDAIIENKYFSSFEEAENHLKKWHNVFLMEDDKYIEIVSKELNVKPAHLRSHFKTIIG